MAVVRWTFYDPVLLETYEMHINPNEGGSPAFKKNVAYLSTTAPIGRTIVFEGNDEVQRLEWSGVILTQEHYDALLLWWRKRRQIQVTDDLGREYWMYIQEFTPKRVRSVQFPWKHEYSAVGVILDIP